MSRAPKGPSTTLERLLLNEGYAVVAGVDEVGRGALAGPVMAAAAVLKVPFDQFEGLGIRDSKLLTPARREELSSTLLIKLDCWSVGASSVEEINFLGIRHATLLAMRRAVEGLVILPDMLLLDGRDTIPEMVIPQRAVISGDRTVLSISAASIIAKVHRDHEMVLLDQVSKGYDLSRNKGYGTEAHRAGLLEFGISVHHRVKFCQTFLSPTQGEIFKKSLG
ncbi:MAG: ribonuclease HII [Leptospirales bacterium]